MKRRNIFFSVIIVLTMILGMYPQNAFATEIQEKDILKKTDECVKVIEETIFELEMEEGTFEEE